MLFNYHSKRWKLTRERVLRRDGYLCRESARYGKRLPASTVHHIYPVSEYPELAWLDWNMVSLSAAAHDAMHKRETQEVTGAGKYWQRKRQTEFLKAMGYPPPCQGSVSDCSFTDAGNSFHMRRD